MSCAATGGSDKVGLTKLSTAFTASSVIESSTSVNSNYFFACFQRFEVPYLRGFRTESERTQTVTFIGCI